MPSSDSWRGGRTWVFQGTVAEDATAGSHLVTLTVTPGVGNEMEIIAGMIVVGNTATAQVVTVVIDDGTNQLVRVINGLSGTTANAATSFPQTGATAISQPINWSQGLFVSGTMRLQLQVTTTAVSVTQAFSVIARVWGDAPTATMADTVGTPTLDTNTNAIM